jgi:hypothetical protein
VEIEETDQNIFEADDPQSEHWRGLQPDPSDRLLIRRSLVRAQVEEPVKSKSYVAKRNPFLFAILESEPDFPISSTSPRSYLSLADGIRTPRPLIGRGIRDLGCDLAAANGRFRAMQSESGRPARDP